MTITDWLSLICPVVIFAVGGEYVARRMSALLDAWMAL